MNLIMTFELFVRLRQTFSRLPALAAGCLLLVLSPLALAQQPVSPEQIGEVSLVLGKAYLEAFDGDRHRIQVGQPVRVSDQIITSANGHVHIRFVDDALISVRPDSHLEVVRYQYDPLNPDASAVKFNLIEGVTRSISGEAARAARERFRLNTPIAAIGVRGTDFVVSASPEMVRALVNEGVIVMAPYSEQCSADAFGPCADNAVELTGESLQIIELNAGTASVTPATHERNPGLLRDEVQQVIADTSAAGNEPDADEQAVGNDVYLEGVTSVKVRADAQQIASSEPAPGPVTPGPPAPPAPPPVVDFTPPTPVQEEVLTDRQLLWGRWAWSNGVGDLERITLSAAEASEGRDITISNLDYGLFRDQGGKLAAVDAGLGVVGFELSSAQAFYSSESGIVAMRVKGGSLDIDFQDNTFATALSLEHAATGLIDFSAMGRIYSGGYFYDRSATQNVVGAVSLDGTEAGYFFDKQLESGGIQGLTLWDSK